MAQFVIDLAKRVYLNTPCESLRRMYFRIFCAWVRNRIVQVSVDEINYRLELGEVIDVCLYLNRYEPDMAAALERLCVRGFVVLDIGANIGAHTLRMAKLVGQSGRVYAFEPTDYAYSKLVHNISLNPFRNIVPLKIVLSDRNLPRQAVRFKSSWPTNGKSVERESIADFTKLDDWCNMEGVERVDLIKLDVDGNEYSVVMGAATLLTRQHPLILMEVWGPNFSDQKKNPFFALKELGYRFFHIDTGKEYVSIEDLRAFVSLDGKLLDHSYNIVASC
jgi:FkbM family methyltransferase